jgi:hypothetical protein
MRHETGASQSGGTFVIAAAVQSSGAPPLGIPAILPPGRQSSVLSGDITHKERLLRFGAELVFAICAAQQVEVVILNQGEDTRFEKDLAKDVLEIGAASWFALAEESEIAGQHQGGGEGYSLMLIFLPRRNSPRHSSQRSPQRKWIGADRRHQPPRPAFSRSFFCFCISTHLFRRLICNRNCRSFCILCCISR